MEPWDLQVEAARAVQHHHEILQRIAARQGRLFNVRAAMQMAEVFNAGTLEGTTLDIGSYTGTSARQLEDDESSTSSATEENGTIPSHGGMNAEQQQVYGQIYRYISDLSRYISKFSG